MARSLDGGFTWEPASGVRENRPPDVIASFATVDSSGSVWIALEVSGGGVRRSTGRVFRSDNAGRHWTEVSTGLRGAVVHRLAVDPREADILYAGTAGQGLYRLRVEQ